MSRAIVRYRNANYQTTGYRETIDTSTFGFFGSPLFWGILYFLSLFKTVRRFFFWGSLLASAVFWSFTLYGTYIQPLPNNTVIGPYGLQAVDYFGWSMSISFGFGVLWVILATMALVTRKTKAALAD